MSGDPARIPSNQTTRGSGAQSRDSGRSRLGVRWLHPTTEPGVTWLAVSTLVLGRGDECDVHLQGAEISRRHAEIRREGPVFVLHDLGSRNGVFINGFRVGEGALSGGDLIRLGEWLGYVQQFPEQEDSPDSTFTYEQGLVAGPVLRPILDYARRAATTDLSVVIQGETGTGKELVARAIHSWSARTGPFLAINCAAFPEALAEAMLFGHRKGAFTGAVQDSRGYFRAAHSGTLFLDEVADLPLNLQPKLLRAIEAGEVIPVGEATPIQVDVRILAACQSPLSSRVSAGTFRRDLAARLDGATLILPPLRQRVEEIPYLFSWHLRKHAGADPPRVEPLLVESLCLYDWPSNVRELDHLVRRLVGLSMEGGILRANQLPEAMLKRSSTVAGAGSPGVMKEGLGARDAREFAEFKQQLRLQGGNVARAAAAVGISRQRGYRLLEAHPEIKIEEFRRRPPANDDKNSRGAREPE